MRARHGGTCLQSQLLRRWRIEFEASTGKISQNLFQKQNTKPKMAEGVAQVVKCLPSIIYARP
jgi:hypothetical protein